MLAGVDIEDNEGSTPLIYSVYNRHREIIIYLSGIKEIGTSDVQVRRICIHAAARVCIFARYVVYLLAETPSESMLMPLSLAVYSARLASSSSVAINDRLVPYSNIQNLSMSLHAFQPYVSSSKPAIIILNTCHGTLMQRLIVKYIPIV